MLNKEIWSGELYKQYILPLCHCDVINISVHVSVAQAKEILLLKITCTLKVHFTVTLLISGVKPVALLYLHPIICSSSTQQIRPWQEQESGAIK